MESSISFASMLEWCIFGAALHSSCWDWASRVSGRGSGVLNLLEFLRMSISCITKPMTEDRICYWFLILTDDKHEALISTPAQGLKILLSLSFLFFLHFGKLFIFWRSVVGSPLWNRSTPLALLKFKSNGISILITSIFIILAADHNQTIWSARPWHCDARPEASC